MKQLRYLYLILIFLPIIIITTYITPIGIQNAFKPAHIVAIITSIIIAIMASLIANIAGAFSAYTLNRSTFKYKSILYLLHLFPLLLPVTSYGLGIQVILTYMNLINSVMAVIITHAVIILPYAFLTYDAAFKLVGPSYETSARILGSTQTNAIKHVLVPMIMPSILNAFSLGFIISFGEYFLTQRIGGGRIKTFSTILVPFLQSDKRYISASFSLLFILVVFTIYSMFNYFSKKYYITLDIDEGH